jgi:ParB family chromosome partitioning protein
MKETIKAIPLSELHPFPENPYKVLDDEELQAMADSIRDYGVISPLVVRPRDEGGYEIIAGHRRKKACEKAGIDTVPAFVRDMDRDTAVITLVDSNLHREHILPSEKAFAYKMKLEAIKHQGIACGQLVHKSRDLVAENNESGRQVQRYIRLTELIPPILQMVDDGNIAFSPAVELSYLAEKEQYNLLETMESEDCTPSLSQAQRMKKLSQDGKLDMDTIFAIMTEEKPNQKEQIKLPKDRIKKFFPKDYTAKQMEEIIMKLLADWQRKREHSRNKER